MKNKKRTDHSEQYVKAFNPATGEIRYFKNGHQTAEAFGCSTPLVYMALDGKTPTCYGWKLEWISDSEPEVQEYKKRLAEKIEKHKMDKMAERRRKARDEYRKKAGPNYRPWRRYRNEVLYKTSEMTYNEQGEKK